VGEEVLLYFIVGFVSYFTGVATMSLMSARAYEKGYQDSKRFRGDD